MSNSKKRDKSYLPCMGLTFGLFWPREPLRRKLYGIKILFKRIIFVLRHGYTPQFLYETFACTIDLYREIIDWYLDPDGPMGEPTLSPVEIAVDGSWTDILHKLRDLLDEMDEEYYLFNKFTGDRAWLNDLDEIAARRNQQGAANEFFALFGKYFYHFWD